MRAKMFHCRSAFTSLVLAALVIAFAVQGTTAGKGWCKADPLVLIDGQVANIFVSAPLDAPLKVTGPTQIVLRVPVGVDAQVILTSPGFGRGEEVTIVESRQLRKTLAGTQVGVAVYVPATDDAMPVLVEFAPNIVGILNPATAEGTANSWVSLKTTL